MYYYRLAGKFTGEELSHDFDKKQISLNYDDIIVTVIAKPFMLAIRSFAYGFSIHEFLFDIDAYIKAISYRF